MPADYLIALRENLLDVVSGSDRSRSLNQNPGPGSESTDGDPATELVTLIHKILTSGLSNDGRSMDYAALRDDPLYQSEFRRCTAKLSTFDPTALVDRYARLAFWINLYNTLILDGVIALGVRRSIMERGLGMTFLRQAAYTVGGERMSCDDIEHGILRANRGHPFIPGRQFPASDPRLRWVIEPFDVRVHFALNCASRSCPPIRAYSAGKLDSQLDLAARSFIANDVEIHPRKNALHLSSLFRWFAKDFGERDGVIDFILSHLETEEDRLWLQQMRAKVGLRYKLFDWRLNARIPAGPRPAG